MQNFVDAYSWINLRYLLQGLGVTLEVSIASIFFSFVLGVILGLARYVKIKYFSAAVGFVIDVIRNLPLLLILFFTYFALPDIDIRLNVIVAAIVAMSIFESAMLAEIVRSGINAVPRGQMEAARSLGLPFGKAMRKVILPQGIKIMIPSFINQFIITLKDTSILSIIGLLELTQTGKIIIARNMEGFKIWTMVALIYLIIITLLTWLSNWVQKKVKA